MHILEYIYQVVIPFFSSREWATIIWIIIFIVWIVLSKVRNSLFDVIKCFFKPKLLCVFGMGYLYLFFFIFILYKENIWQVFLLKDTIIYILITSTQMTIKAIDQNTEKPFTSILSNNIKATYVIAFYIHLSTFNFWITFISLPIICFFILIQLTAEHSTKLEEKKLSYYFKFLLNTFYIIFFLSAVFWLVTNYNIILKKETILSLMLPIILSFAFFPYMYLLAVYCAYELWFIRIKASANNNIEEYKYRRNNVVRRCIFNLNKIQYISKNFHVFMMETNEEFNNTLKQINDKYRQSRNHTTYRT